MTVNRLGAADTAAPPATWARGGAGRPRPHLTDVPVRPGTAGSDGTEAGSGSMEWMLAVPLLALLTFNSHGLTSRPVPLLEAKSPCDVIPIRDIESWTGHLMMRTSMRRTLNESTCDYTSGEAAITISARRSALKIDLPAELGHLKQAFPEARLAGVDGLGAAAILVDLGESGVLLNVFRNEHDYLMVSVLGLGNGAKVTPFAIRVARAIQERL